MNYVPQYSCFVVAVLLGLGTSGGADAGSLEQRKGVPVAARMPIVSGLNHGRIYGFDIQADGDYGILSEKVGTAGPGGVETFDVHTGRIVDVVANDDGPGIDHLTLGIFDSKIALVEEESYPSGHPLDVTRTYPTLAPITFDEFNGMWHLPFHPNSLVYGVSRNEGPVAAIVTLDNGGSSGFHAFESYVERDESGSSVAIPVTNFLSTAVGYNPRTRQALVGDGSGYYPAHMILIDFASGTATPFQGVGMGIVDGIAIDPETNIACVTNQISVSLGFFDLSTLEATEVQLPGWPDRLKNGTDVAVDPIHHLFLVAQSESATESEPGHSDILVYSEDGTLLRSIGGFHFSNNSNVVRTHIALNPAHRFGFVDGPATDVSSIQGFRY